MSRDDDSLGSRLRAARLAAGLSQAKLAAQSGIPKPRLSQYENDRLRPSVTTLRRLAAAVGVTESVLLGGDELEVAFVAELRRLGITFRDGDDVRATAAEVAAARAGRRARRAPPAV